MRRRCLNFGLVRGLVAIHIQSPVMFDEWKENINFLKVQVAGVSGTAYLFVVSSVHASGGKVYLSCG